MVNTGAAFTQPSHYAYKYNAKGEGTNGDRFEGTDPDHPGLPILPETYAYDDIGNRKTATNLTVNGQPGTVNSVYTANPLTQYAALTTTVNGEPTTVNPAFNADGNLTDDAR